MILKDALLIKIVHVIRNRWRCGQLLLRQLRKNDGCIRYVFVWFMIFTRKKYYNNSGLVQKLVSKLINKSDILN